MGMDKEAADIWMFGKPRPDLTIEETIEAWKNLSTSSEAPPKADPVAYDAYIDKRFPKMVVAQEMEQNIPLSERDPWRFARHS